jgi:hypothetical protein
MEAYLLADHGDSLRAGIDRNTTEPGEYAPLPEDWGPVIVQR